MELQHVEILLSREVSVNTIFANIGNYNTTGTHDGELIKEQQHENFFCILDLVMELQHSRAAHFNLK